MSPEEFVELCRSGTAAQVREAIEAGALVPERADANAQDDE